MGKGGCQPPGDVVGDIVAADRQRGEVSRVAVLEAANAGGAAADVDDRGADFGSSSTRQDSPEA